MSGKKIEYTFPCRECNKDIEQLKCVEHNVMFCEKTLAEHDKQIRAEVIEPIEEFVRECKINKAMDKPCDECKYSHHSHHQTCLEYVLEQLKSQN